MMLNQTKKSNPSLQEKLSRIPGRPVISSIRVDAPALKNVCPRHAIGVNPDRIDLGKCNFCGDCAVAFPFKISFTDDLSTATNVRDRLVVIEGDNHTIEIDAQLVREKIKTYDAGHITLYPTSADHSSSTGHTVALQDFGISISADVAACEGILIEGDLNAVSNEELSLLYAKLKDPKVIVVSGMTAITAIGCSSQHAEFFTAHTIDLYVPGDPAMPETLGKGIRALLNNSKTSPTNYNV